MFRIYTLPDNMILQNNMLKTKTSGQQEFILPSREHVHILLTSWISM